MEQNLSTNVYNTLLERLFTNELVPGEILNRRAVAEELGTSVAPVLEAMLQLESEGFLESIPRKGTQVRVIREEDIRGHLIVREALECQAARMYCGSPVRDNEQELRELAELVDTTEPRVTRMRRDIDFHRFLVQLTECEILISEYERMMKVTIFQSMNRMLDEDDRSVHYSHTDLVGRLKTEEPDVAESIIREHLRSGKAHFLKVDSA